VKFKVVPAEDQTAHFTSAGGVIMPSISTEGFLPSYARPTRSKSMKSHVTTLDERIVMAMEDEAHLLVDKEISKRVNRKMDIALLPFLSLLYLFNGLDRSNVGNAETQGRFNFDVDHQR
jgi:hypothetical protein